MLDLKKIDKSWTLFLDRDGVINHESRDEYVLNWKTFVFYDQAPENIRYFNSLFNRIIVVTNQRGISKGLMTVGDLEDIHSNMMRALSEKQARIDRIYYCLGADMNSPCRKPNPGMAHQAKEDFPDLDFNKSIMIGNNLSDMIFARNAGMHAVFLRTTSPDLPLPHPAIDGDFNDLNDFAQALKNR
jgi:D-glycero-D-manno-heptose 1,7-bisphosphate phosphatase